MNIAVCLWMRDMAPRVCYQLSLGQLRSRLLKPPTTEAIRTRWDSDCSRCRCMLFCLDSASPSLLLALLLTVVVELVRQIFCSRKEID